MMDLKDIRDETLNEWHEMAMRAHEKIERQLFELEVQRRAEREACEVLFAEMQRRQRDKENRAKLDLPQQPPSPELVHTRPPKVDRPTHCTCQNGAIGICWTCQKRLERTLDQADTGEHAEPKGQVMQDGGVLHGPCYFDERR